jgi:hypothetical protein
MTIREMLIDAAAKIELDATHLTDEQIAAFALNTLKQRVYMKAKNKEKAVAYRLVKKMLAKRNEKRPLEFLQGSDLDNNANE